MKITIDLTEDVLDRLAAVLATKVLTTDLGHMPGIETPESPKMGGWHETTSKDTTCAEEPPESPSDVVDKPENSAQYSDIENAVKDLLQQGRGALIKNVLKKLGVDHFKQLDEARYTEAYKMLLEEYFE